VIGKIELDVWECTSVELQGGLGVAFLQAISRDKFGSLCLALCLALLKFSNLGVSASLCGRTLCVTSRIAY
jgi:hypothetical protein